MLLTMVAGMKCGGCVGHVKQLLEQHSSVSAATVNLATETALVRVKLEPGADLSTLAAELAKVSKRDRAFAVLGVFQLCCPECGWFRFQGSRGRAWGLTCG